MTNFNSVKKFMEVFGQEVKTKAEFPSEKIIKLRYNLIKEELDEFEEALKDKNLKEARSLYKQLLPIIRLVGGHRYVSATKAALMEIGQPVGLPRSPRLPLPDNELNMVKEALERSGCQRAQNL